MIIVRTSNSVFHTAVQQEKQAVVVHLPPARAVEYRSTRPVVEQAAKSCLHACRSLWTPLSQLRSQQAKSHSNNKLNVKMVQHQ